MAKIDVEVSEYFNAICGNMDDTKKMTRLLLSDDNPYREAVLVEIVKSEAVKNVINKRWCS